MDFKNGSIVTANFTDRKSEHPWLASHEKDEPQKAIAFKAVVATGIAFKESDPNGYEKGFGCSIVAVCKTATGMDKDPVFDKAKTRQLRFCYWWFEDAETREKVPSLETLYLTSDGHMYGVLPAAAKNNKKEPVETTEA